MWHAIDVSRWVQTRGVAAPAVIPAMAMLLIASTASASAPSERTSYWHPWFEIGGYHNSRSDDDSTGAGGSTNRGETTVFAPVRGSKRTLLFGQLTAKFFDDTAKEGNFALGYRQMMLSGFNIGTWIGADVRKSAIDNTFWQLSGGFEALSENIDFRVNWYGPTTAPKQGVAGFAQVQLQGSQLLMTGGEEVAMMGVDGEIGIRLPTEHLRLDPKIFELRAYGGGYYFDHADAAQEVVGVKGRIEFRVNDIIASLPGSRLTAEYEVTHDDVRDTRHDVGLRVRIPFGGKSTPALASLTGQQRRMLDGIERDTDIVSGPSKAEPVEDALTGTDLDRTVFANNTTDVTTASNNAGDNAHIIVNGDVEGSQTLQGNQTLQGGGSTINVRGRKSGTVTPFTAPGAPGRLTTPGDAESNLSLNGSNIHVSGIVIGGYEAQSDEQHGVSIGSDRDNIYLTNFSISDAGANSVHILDRNEVKIVNLTSNGAFGSGIRMRNNNEVTITESSITDTQGAAGVYMNSANTVTIKDTRISGTFAGINANTNNTLNINGSSFTNALFGLLLNDASAGNGNHATVTNTTFSGPLFGAVGVGENNTLALSNSVINSNNGSVDIGLLLTANSTLSVNNTTFNGEFQVGYFRFDGAGITVDTPNSTGNINNATVGGSVCALVNGGAFTGEISFVDGTVVNQGNCN